MPKATLHDADLTALRQAAEHGDFNACVEATARLLSRMPLHQVMELIRLQVTRRMPAFEQHQPGVSWPRQLLEHLERGTLPPDWEWPTHNDEFPGPGANNFIQSLEDLWEVSQHPKEGPSQMEALAGAISGLIIMDKLVESAARKPELWAYWHRSARTGEFDPHLYTVQHEMVHNPEAERLGRLGWLDVAQRCAEALGLD